MKGKSMCKGTEALKDPEYPVNQKQLIIDWLHPSRWEGAEEEVRIRLVIKVLNDHSGKGHSEICHLDRVLPKIIQPGRVGVAMVLMFMSSPSPTAPNSYAFNRTLMPNVMVLGGAWVMRAASWLGLVPKRLHRAP